MISISVRATMSFFRVIVFFIIMVTEVYTFMNNTENNATNEKMLADADAIEKVIAELPVLTRQGTIGIVNIQRALRCGYATAAKIYDLIKDKSRIKIEKSFFELDAKRQMLYLEQILNDALPDSGYTPDEVYERLYKEMAVIESLGMAADFLFARSVAEILRELNQAPCFVGIGCCSLVAFMIGITEPELDPIEHGLIFERGFGDGKKPEMPFSFFVSPETVPEFTERMNKIYGDTLSFRRDGGLVLSVGDTSVTVIDTIEPLRQSYAGIEESINDSGIAVFQEDYMRIMHYAAGYDYTEADNIRKTIGKRKTEQIEKYRREFVRKAAHGLSLAESQRLFAEIEFKLKHACCKAYVLSAKTVLDALCFD